MGFAPTLTLPSLKTSDKWCRHPLAPSHHSFRVTSKVSTLVCFLVCTSVQLDIYFSILLEISLATDRQFHKTNFTPSVNILSLDLSLFPFSDSFSYTCHLSPSNSDTQISFFISTFSYPILRPSIDGYPSIHNSI